MRADHAGPELVVVGGDAADATGGVNRVDSAGDDDRPAESWFVALFRREADAVFGYARRRTADEDAAADVVADVFLAAWRRRADLDHDNVRPWLFGVAAKVLANQRRGDQRRGRLVRRVDSTSPRSTADLQDAVVEREFVRSVLDRLSDEDAETLRLAEWDRLTAAEAAQVVGCSEGTFRARLHRARRRFAVALGEAEGDERDPS